MLTVFCDFDGTITTKDTTDLILQQFAPTTWEIIEQQYLNNQITSQQCMQKQIELLNVSFSELQDFLNKNIVIEPDFKDFVAACKRLKVDLFIVSDGLDLVIKHILQYHNINAPTIYANELQVLPNNKYSLKFPNYKNDCKAQLGNCKCAVIKKLNINNYSLYIGDGRSDYCPALNEASTVIAKGSLINYCETNNIPFTNFTNFTNILNIIESNLIEGTYEQQ